MAIFKHALAALFFVSIHHSAFANERWICTFLYSTNSVSSADVSFTVAGTMLVERPYEARYTILENNDHALLAEQHYADYDNVLQRTLIYLTSVMIDKSTQVINFTSEIGGEKPNSHLGRCRRHDNNTKSGIGLDEQRSLK